jgi:ABC-2 type transport system ATP-binding protein
VARYPRWTTPAIAVAALAVLVTGVVRVATWGPPAVRTTSEVVVVPGGPTYGGQVKLPTTLFLPRRTPAPAVVLSPGFGETKDGLAGQARALARHGYVVLTWTMRGFGGPDSGRIALDAPDTEVADLHALIDRLAQRRDVVQDGPGDPRVGLVGDSYGGGISLQGAAYDKRVDAVVPVITWNSLATSLVPGGVFKAQYASVFFAGAAGAGCLRFAERVCSAYQRIAQTGTATPDDLALLQRSDAPVAQIAAPTLLVQGQDDTLFPLAESLATARTLAARGTPVHLAWFDGGHDQPFSSATTREIRSLTTSWLDRWLRRDPHVRTGPVFRWDRSTGGEGTARVLPPLTSLTAVEVAGTRTVTNPPGGRPASITSVPGFGALSAGLGLEIPGQTARWDSAPLASTRELVGVGLVRAHVRSSSGEAVLFVSVRDVAPDGAVRLPHGQVQPVRLTGVGGAGRDVVLQLPALTHVFPAGHRVRVLVATTDLGYAGPSAPASYDVGVSGAVLPLVPIAQGDGYGRLALVAGLLGAALLALLGVLVARRRRHPLDLGDDDAPPVEMRGLAKSYADGFRAVDGIDLVVERGQVLGLLGPNGAGKTTALRMLAGLITPTEGEVRLFGRPVTSGADVLNRVGFFVEGPGLLPHLTGLQNLELYWTSVAPDMSGSYVEEALEIAGLGDAVHRKVKAYSHGMKQRLAIAQAMLGRPDLLVLDEPTNGLDPPQIKEVREVLKRIAATGRTVLVSSHLLAEVEQTCTHVAVMSRGRMLAAGPVEELLTDRSTHVHRRLEDVFLELVGATR